MAGQGNMKARRAAAVDRAIEVGIEQAASEAGVRVETLHRWAEVRGVELPEPVESEMVVEAGPAAVAPVIDVPAADEDAGADPSDPATLLATARRAHRAADAAIRRLEAALPSARNPRDLSIAVGVLLDKSGQLAESVRALEDRDVRLAGEHAETIAALLRVFLQALELERSRPALQIMRRLLEDVSSGAILLADPVDVEAVRVEMREHHRVQLRRELRDELRAEIERELGDELSRQASERAEKRGLPAPSGEPEQERREEMAGPRRVVRAEPPDAVVVEEEVTGEVVEPDDDEPSERVPTFYLDAFKGNEAMARRAWERKRQDAERESRERDAVYAPPSRWKGIGDMGGGYAQGPVRR